MISLDFDFILLNLILLCTFATMGILIGGKYKHWWPIGLCILVFTLVEGFRYGRGVDYLHYLDVYNYDLEDGQVLFTAFNRFLKAVGIPDIFCFIFYALIFICCAMRLMKEMKVYAKYLLPVFIICFTVFHESFIRQALGTSFVFLYIVQLNAIITDSVTAKTGVNKKAKSGRKKNKENSRKNPLKSFKDYALLVLLALVAYSIHSMLVITILVITVAFIFVRKPVKWYFSIPLLLIGKFIISKSFDWGSINGLLNALSGVNEKFAAYSDNADRWFSDDAVKDQYTRNIIVQVLETIGNCAMFYLGAKLCEGLQKRNIEAKTAVVPCNWKYIRKDVLYVSLFNITLFGTILFQTFFNVELVRRISMSWSLFWFVPVSMILYYRNSKIFNKFDRTLMFALIFFIWDYFRFMFLWSHTPLFIWDI